MRGGVKLRFAELKLKFDTYSVSVSRDVFKCKRIQAEHLLTPCVIK